MDLSWMAWTWQTATFFAAIGGALIGMSIWEYARPGGAPRRGILGLDTTRGDRLFISLLCAAFIHLGWLLLPAMWPLWGASIVAAALAVVIFCWV